MQQPDEDLPKSELSTFREYLALVASLINAVAVQINAVAVVFPVWLLALSWARSTNEEDEEGREQRDYCGSGTPHGRPAPRFLCVWLDSRNLHPR